MDKFLIIDRQNLRFLGVGASMQLATHIAWNDHPSVPVLILPLEAKRYFSQLSRMELMMLHKNELKQDASLFDVEQMIPRLHAVADELPVDTRSFTELTNASVGLDELPPPLPKHVPSLNKADPSQSYPARAVSPADARPKAPSIPKIPGDPNAKPSPKGATGKVWLIADRVWAENGSGVISKELRTKIIAACEVEGIHPATAATQYSKWKATK